MQGIRSTFALLVVFVSLGAYIYFVERHQPPASDVKPNEKVFDFDSKELKELQIKTKAGTATKLHQDNNAWKITAPVEARANENNVSSITATLSSLELQRIVEETKVDLSPFGLAEPAIDITFSLNSDDSLQQLLIGDETPTGSNRYAKLSNSDRIFLIASHIESAFNKSTFDLRDRRLLAFERENLDSLIITRNNNEDTRLQKDQNNWKIIEPWNARADFSTVESLVGALSSGEMISIEHEETEALDDYGLQNPSTTISIGTGSSTAKLALGKESPNGTRYARDVSRTMVFTISQSLASDLERAPSEYRRKDMFRFRPFNASWLEIKQAEESITFEKNEANTDGEVDSWKRIEPEIQDTDKDKMDDLLTKLSNLRAMSFVVSREDFGLSDNELLATIKVRFRDGDDSIEEYVAVWRSDNTTFAVSENETGAAIIDTRTFDDILNSLPAIQTEHS